MSGRKATLFFANFLSRHIQRISFAFQAWGVAGNDSCFCMTPDLHDLSVILINPEVSDKQVMRGAKEQVSGYGF